MPFGYYDRLSRKEQAIYRESDRHTSIRLPDPAALHPVVEALATALTAEDRAAIQRASERLVNGIVQGLGLPPVRLEVLAARPRNNYGELHGLYTAERGRTPKIQLWMRTAAQKRVVAFRTYLRTLLHEVGHHVDYTHLGLGESFHTEGFYKRESSLFYQLVPEARSGPRTFEEWAKRSADDRMRQLSRTPHQIADAIAGASAWSLARGTPRAPVEVIAYLRDLEEFFLARLRGVLDADEPAIAETPPIERWREERGYLREDAGRALEVFRARRGEMLAALMALSAEDWTRVGIHPTRGRVSVDDFVTLMAWNDDAQLDVIRKAVGDAGPTPRRQRDTSELQRDEETE